MVRGAVAVEGRGGLQVGGGGLCSAGPSRRAKRRYGIQNGPHGSQRQAKWRSKAKAALAAARTAPEGPKLDPQEVAGAITFLRLQVADAAAAGQLQAVRSFRRIIDVLEGLDR
jgi:hypothetical protein